MIQDFIHYSIGSNLLLTDWCEFRTRFDLTVAFTVRFNFNTFIYVYIQKRPSENNLIKNQTKNPKQNTFHPFETIYQNLSLLT